MSPAFGIFVTVITLATIAASYLLLHFTRRSEPLGAAGKEKNHEFDGIRELETPLPRWWYWLFVGSMLFALGYLVFYPGLGNFAGVLGWNQVLQHNQEQRAASTRYGALFAELGQRSLEELARDPKAQRVGARLFGVHCAQCHGEGGRGNFGFPNLADQDWHWGGSGDAIATTIAEGRTGVMPAWLLPLGGERGVTDVANHVLAMGGRPHDRSAAARGRSQFGMICVSCHGADGKGNDALGAPDLTDSAWVYGGTLPEIAFSIRNGRTGRMPAFADKLDAPTRHVLAAYVLGIGADPAAVP